MKPSEEQLIADLKSYGSQSTSVAAMHRQFTHAPALAAWIAAMIARVEELEARVRRDLGPAALASPPAGPGEAEPSVDKLDIQGRLERLEGAVFPWAEWTKKE